MKRLSRLLTLLFFVLVPSLQAQEDTAPWPPDPSEIFAEGVEIVDTVVRNHSIVDTSPRLDNDARIVYVYDYLANIWEEYPYPNGVQEFRYIFSWGEDSIIVYQERDPSGEPNPDGAFIIDRRQGTITPAHEHCGVVSPPTEENKWIFIADTQSGHLILCNTFTGASTAPLPADITPIMGMWHPEPGHALADSSYVAFIGADSQTQTNYVTGYSYSRETNEFVRLGDFRSDDYNNVGGWAINDIVTFYTDGMPEWSQCQIYVAQAAVENSLEFAISGIRYCPGFVEGDQTRLVTISDGDNSEFVDGQCSRTEYDILTGETTRFDYDGLCWADYTRENGISYHRRVNFPQRDHATLVRYNPETHEQIELFEGEIEWVSWVSEDDHYAALVLDDSGYITIVPGSDSQWWSIEGGGTLALVDLTNDHILYQIHAGWITDLTTGWPTSYIQRISEQELFALEAVPIENGYTYRALSVNLTNEGAVESEIIDGIVYELHSLPKQFLIWTDDSTTAGALNYDSSLYNAEITAPISLYDMTAGTITPITTLIDSENYQLVLLRELDAEHLIFMVHPRIVTSEGYHRVDDTRSVTYTIRLP